MKRFLTAIFIISHAFCFPQEGFLFSDSAIMARMSTDLHILASDSLAGRRLGSPGEKKAYTYIIEKFTQAGLTPAGVPPTSFLQPFSVGSTRIPSDSNSLKIEGLYEALFPWRDFCPVALSANGRAEGNRYVLVDLARFNRNNRSKQSDHGPSLRQVVREAFQQGNEAVFLMNEWLLKGLERDSLYNRVGVKPENGLVVSINSATAEFLGTHPGIRVSIRINVTKTAITGYNIIGMIDNKAPNTIIIGAHYDHLGISRSGKIFRGADDNGSGTVMLMELARHLKASGDTLSNYLFIAFSGEEEGLYGSAFFVRHPVVDLKTVNFMMNLDMVGRLGCEGNLVTVFGTGTSPLWHTLYKETEHPKFRICRMHGVHGFTDHLDFYHHGIPITSFTTGFHYEYHTTRDAAETINYIGMKDLAKYLEGLLHNAATKGKIGYHKVSGWYNFSTNLKIVIKDIDHLLTVGMEQ